MADLVLGAATCATCGNVVKGYIVDNSDGAEGSFIHVTSGNDEHEAWPNTDTFQILPAEVWHAIAANGT